VKSYIIAVTHLIMVQKKLLIRALLKFLHAKSALPVESSLRLASFNFINLSNIA